MTKTGFLGIRIEEPLHRSINEIVETNQDYKTVTEFCNSALHLLIAGVETNKEHCMSHPDYPDLVKLVGSIGSMETRNVLYEKLKYLHFNEVTAVFTWLKRAS